MVPVPLQYLGAVSIYDETLHHKISRTLEATRLDFISFQSHWNVCVGSDAADPAVKFQND